MTASPGDDRTLVRRAARRIALQTALVFVACVVVLGAATGVILVRSQNQDSQQRLREAIADVDAVSDPPSGVDIYEVASGQVKASSDLHGRPLDRPALAQARTNHAPTTTTVRIGSRKYLVRTAWRGNTLVQAGLDLTDQDRERNRLLNMLAVVGGTALVLALVAGLLIARRAIAPMGTALGRQQRFVADASHELRTPLTQVHTRAQMLRARLLRDGHSDLADEADRLVRGTRQLGEIIDELLLSAQLGALPQATEPVDLDQIVRDVIDADRPAADSHEIGLLSDIGAGSHVVPGAETALRRVIGSLVDNAIAHTPRGGQVTVRLRRLSAVSVVRCTVSDTGAGFDASDAERIFERFARGTHGRGRRHGIGLALAREVVAAHRGTITAESRPGKGATFTIDLPASAATTDAST